MLRDNHYDQAFEEFLREVRTPYVVVDETRRALLQDASLKSMDFIVYSSRAENLLVDVKGRRFPSGNGPGHRWENWTTEEDISSLLRWQQVFGSGFRALLVFAYNVVDQKAAQGFRDLFKFRDRQYAFFGIWVDEYSRSMRARSASWNTVWLPSQQFHALRAPIQNFL